ACLVQFLSWQSSLLKEVLAAVVQLLLSIERLLGRFGIKFRLAHFFRKGGDGRACICRLGLRQAPFVFLLRCGQVTVLKYSQQLPGFNPAAAVHGETLHGCTDLGCDGGLLERKQDRLCADDFLQRSLSDFSDLDADHWPCFLLRFRACADQAQGGEHECQLLGMGHRFRTPPLRFAVRPRRRGSAPVRHRKHHAPASACSVHPRLPKQWIPLPGTAASSIVSSRWLTQTTSAAGPVAPGRSPLLDKKTADWLRTGAG